MRTHSFAFALLTLVLTACGGGGGSGSSSSSSSSGGPAALDTVALAASGSTALVPGASNTDLEFVLTNNTSTEATSVVLKVTLGEGLSRAGLSCTATGGGQCPSNLDSLELTRLARDSTVTFRMGVIVASGSRGPIVSSAIVTATNDGVASNNTAQITINSYSADVALTGSTTAVASDLESGNIVPYELTVSNNGPDAAQNVRIETYMSDGQELQSVDCAASGAATCPGSTGADMTVPVLANGGALVFTFNSRLTRDVRSSISSTSRITVPGETNHSNNVATITARTRIPVSANSPTFVALYSDSNDWVGAGKDYQYDGTNAKFEVYTEAGRLHFKVDGYEYWTADFYMPANQTQVLPGLYAVPFRSTLDTGTGTFSWYGQGHSCDHSGWVQIDDIVFAEGQLVSVDLRFAQHCSDSYPALRGQVHWIANDATRPSGPVDPAPSGLWVPSPGATPASGNFLYVEGDPDYPGLWGGTELFTPVDSVVDVSHSLPDGYVTFNAWGDSIYTGGMRAMLPLSRLAPGYYESGVRGFGNPVLANFGIARSNTRGCLYSAGWFVVDNIAFAGDEIIALDARFEDSCDFLGNIRGQIHWRHDDPAPTPGPVVPPPVGLWAPPAGAVPTTGNAIYIESDVGDYIGQGMTKLYTPLDSIFDIENQGMTPAGNRFQIGVSGDQNWHATFHTMATLPDLQVGYYGGALRFNSPARGSLDFGGEGRGCNELGGWFVIDRLVYSGSRLDAIELRFEQHCEGRTAALRGFIRWERSDTRDPLPPVNPPPAGLWDAPAGSTPATGNYVYLQSEADDYVGAGRTYLHASPSATISVAAMNPSVRIDVVEGVNTWFGGFVSMLPFDRLQAGYYGNLVGGSSRARGAASWGGNGRGCGGAHGWFVVDAVSYDSAGVITALDARFEQRCYATAPALRGKVHWRR